MKRCELCGIAARMYCESDQASLCWDCDHNVHSANFLVAKHCRILLCKVCQSPTPWKASGPRLGATVSVCDSCFTIHNSKRNLHAENLTSDQGSHEGGNDVDDSEGDQDFDEDDTDDDDDSDDYDDEDDDDEEKEEDGENQVVPWSGSTTSVSSSSHIPPAASSSSSEGEASCAAARSGFLKRMRDCNADLDSDDEIGSSTLKQRRRNLVEERVHHGHVQEMSRSTAIIDSLERLERNLVTNGENASAAILGICRLSRDQRH